VILACRQARQDLGRADAEVLFEQTVKVARVVEAPALGDLLDTAAAWIGRGELEKTAGKRALTQVGLYTAMLLEQVVEAASRAAESAAQRGGVQLLSMQVLFDVAFDGRQTDKRDRYLTLILRAHLEQRNGCRFHLDRFDAYLNGQRILTSRQPWYGGARELLRRGYPGGTLLTLRDAGDDYDRFVLLEIGYLAPWSVSDSGRGGLKRIRWQPMPEHLRRGGR
jgi:hypothetical protein